MHCAAVLFDDYQIGALQDGVALADLDLYDLAVTIGGDDIFHLHGFEHEELLPTLDGVAHLTVDGQDNALWLWWVLVQDA